MPVEEDAVYFNPKMTMDIHSGGQEDKKLPSLMFQMSAGQGGQPLPPQGGAMRTGSFAIQRPKSESFMTAMRGRPAAPKPLEGQAPQMPPPPQMPVPTQEPVRSPQAADLNLAADPFALGGLQPQPQPRELSQAPAGPNPLLPPQAPAMVAVPVAGPPGAQPVGATASAPPGAVALMAPPPATVPVVPAVPASPMQVREASPTRRRSQSPIRAPSAMAVMRTPSIGPRTATVSLPNVAGGSARVPSLPGSVRVPVDSKPALPQAIRDALGNPGSTLVPANGRQMQPGSSLTASAGTGSNVAPPMDGLSTSMRSTSGLTASLRQVQPLGNSVSLQPLAQRMAAVRALVDAPLGSFQPEVQREAEAKKQAAEAQLQANAMQQVADAKRQAEENKALLEKAEAQRLAETQAQQRALLVAAEAKRQEHTQALMQSAEAKLQAERQRAQQAQVLQLVNNPLPVVQPLGASLKVQQASTQVSGSYDGIARQVMPIKTSYNPPVYTQPATTILQTQVSDSINAAFNEHQYLQEQQILSQQAPMDGQYAQENEQAYVNTQFIGTLPRGSEYVQYVNGQPEGIYPEAGLAYENLDVSGHFAPYNVEGEYVQQQYMQSQPVDGYGNEYVEYMDSQVGAADAAAGIPLAYEEKQSMLQIVQGALSATQQAAVEAAQEEQQADQGEDEDQFTRLLNSLEARVDLMAQMQHTRAQIQKHTRSLQANNPDRRVRSGSPTRPEIQADEEFFNLPDMSQPDAIGADYNPDYGREGFPDVNAPTMAVDGNMELAMQNYVPPENQVATQSLDTSASQLAYENKILWNQFQDQRDCISKLTGEVEGMRAQIREMSQGPPGDPGSPDNRNSQASMLLSSLTTAPRGRSGFEEANASLGAGGRRSSDPFPAQPSQGFLQGNAMTPVVGQSATQSLPVGAFDGGGRLEDLLSRTQEADVEVQSLHLQLIQERQRQEASSQQWNQERKRLLDELTSLRRPKMGGLPTVGEFTEEGVGTGRLDTQPVFGVPGDSMLQTEEVLAANGLAEDALSGLSTGDQARAVGRLSPQPIGVNIELSEDGYTARRTRGCRQSVVIGTTPLEPQDQGWYFEVVVRETVSGWVGGLGIGVTRTAPSELRRLPDKGWRVPNTFIVGYWGCVFLDGRERRTRWKADSLVVGSRVGLLVSGDGRGDLIVFVDDEPVVRADGVLQSAGRLDPLFPVIDVFAATLSIEVQRTATAPPKPWGTNPSPPGSPASVARSVASSSLTAFGSIGSQAFGTIE